MNVYTLKDDNTKLFFVLKKYNKRNRSISEDEFEDTKDVNRIRTSKKDKQHNGQKKKDKRTSNDLQNIHIKLKIE
jgi:hypothetical protein